jgi:hypothetical protein
MNLNETWICGRCGQEAETLYFDDGRRICDACRDRACREKRLAAQAVKTTWPPIHAKGEPADDATCETGLE